MPLKMSRDQAQLHSGGVWVELPSMPSNSTSTPSMTGVFADSLGSDSGVGYAQLGSLAHYLLADSPSGGVKADWALDPVE